MAKYESKCDQCTDRVVMDPGKGWRHEPDNRPAGDRHQANGSGPIRKN